MSKQISIAVEPRELTGTTNARRLRRLHQKIPGVIYGNQDPSVYFCVEQRHIAKVSQEEAFYSQILELKFGKKKERVVLREIQRHPATEKVLHIDFLRVSDDRELQTTVPVHFLNEELCEGVKLQGGVVAKNLTEIEISCLPKDLPEFIPVDLIDKVVGDSVHLSDLTIPEGVSIVALTQGEEHDTQVVSIHLPKGTVTDEEEEEVQDETPDDDAEEEPSES